MSASQRFTVARPGTHFDASSGKIRIFTEGSITVMKAWPPMAWQKTGAQPAWAHVRPSITVPVGNLENQIFQMETPAENNGQLLLPYVLPPRAFRVRNKQLAWLKWYATIPSEVRQLVHHFPTRQWHMLSFIARCGGPATDLAQSNPALAFALANNWVFHKPAVQRPLRSARSLLATGKKQRDILKWLGFPETKAARRILAKISQQALSIPTLLYFRDAMAAPELFKAMSHLPVLNAGVIRILTDPRLFQHVSFTLLEELAHRREENRHPCVAYILIDILEMMLQEPARFYPQKIRNCEHLARLHDELMYGAIPNRPPLWYRNLQPPAFDIDGPTVEESPQFLNTPFPPPPVPGMDTIVPITTAKDLVEEGEMQHNCVASYIRRVVFHKRYYIYRVLEPERCTLALFLGANNTWCLSELKLAHNRRPKFSTWQAVKTWFEAQTGMPVDTAASACEGPWEEVPYDDFDEACDDEVDAEYDCVPF